MTDTIKAYHVDAFAARYESVSPDKVHAALTEFIPDGRDQLALMWGPGRDVTPAGWRLWAMR